MPETGSQIIQSAPLLQLALALLFGILIGGLVVWLLKRRPIEVSVGKSMSTEANLLDNLRLHTTENYRLSGAEGERVLFEYVMSEAWLAARIEEVAEAIDTSDTYDEAFDRAKVIPFPSRESEPDGDPGEPEPPKDDEDWWSKFKGKGKGVKDKVLKMANQKIQSTAKSWIGEQADDDS